MSHHIVIVEDEPVTQARLQAYFEQEGYQVSAVASGAGLRDIMDQQSVDLVLLDINLPDENGLMLTRSLRMFLATRWKKKRKRLSSPALSTKCWWHL